MCGGEIGTKKALESCWSLGGSVLLPRIGADVEFSRRIPFGAHDFQVSMPANMGQVTFNNHWTFDAGLGVEARGWSGWRPQLLGASLRAGLAYNIHNIWDIGLRARAGYANTVNASEDESGLLWSVGLRSFVAVPFGSESIGLGAEGGALSAPVPEGGSRLGPYALVTGAYLF